MITLTTLIEILVAIVVVGGAIVGFFSMQTRQNMKINELEREVAELKTEMLEEREKRIKTGENIVKIFEKLDHISTAIDDLKAKN